MKPLTGGDRSRRTDSLPYAVLDVETDGLRGPLLYWTVACEHGARADGATADALWRLVLSHNAHGHSWREHVWWAHNGGAYDYLYLLPPARDDVRERGAVVTPITRADAIIGWRVTHAKHRTDLRDSYALLPSPLRGLADQLAPDLPKLDIGLSAGVTFDPANPAHREYAARDSDALLAVLVQFRAILAERWAGVLPSWSAASTALRAWRAMIPPGTEYQHPPPPAAELARLAYFGGMVRVGSIAWHADLVTLDRNSMYPAVMLAGVPGGECVSVTRYVPGRPAFYRVTVEVPLDAEWTQLPYRDPSGALAWPTGTYLTAITSAEYEWAIAHGVRVKVHDGWAWARLDYPFRAFVDTYAAARAEGGAFSAAAKVIGNGLYGKFGSRPTHDDWRLSLARPGPEWYSPAFDAADQTEVDRYAGLWVRRDVPLHADYLMPHWAAWVTAGSRLALADLAERIGPAAIVYADTDSLTFPAPLLARVPPAALGAALGQWKVEHRWALFRAHAPKVYEGTLDNGDPLRKAKGIPRALVADAYATGKVAWDSPNGSLQVLAGAPMLTARERSLSSLAGSQAWREGPGGSVRPVHLAGNERLRAPGRARDLPETAPRGRRRSPVNEKRQASAYAITHAHGNIGGWERAMWDAEEADAIAHGEYTP